MALRFYNTLTRQLEEFRPLNPPEVKIYVCGPTVYNFLHVGNFRGPVVFNLLRQWLEEKGFVVNYVLNFTDVDDKIIEASVSEKIPATEISEKYIFEYKKDFSMLGLRAHELNPKVTDSMPAIVDFIQTLVEQGKAYIAGADVYYSVRSFPEYGKLSGRKVDDLLSGARVEVGELKKDPLDFALWKGAKQGESAWDSPWGAGRPGWHIECSAMVCEHLGEQIDIHGGGTDLLFPHHENEIAQSEGALGKRFVGTWIHWNMLNFGGQKMSKSLGNFTTMRDFLNKHHPEIYKWMILSVHHRTAADFTSDAVDRAVTGLARVYSAMAVAETLLQSAPADLLPDASLTKSATETWTRISEAFDDDLGTPEAFAAMFEFIRLFNSQVKRGIKANVAAQGKALAFKTLILRFGKLLSLFQQSPSEFLRELDDRLLSNKAIKREEIDALVLERTQVRKNKDFKRSDELRDQLVSLGISLSDTPEGTDWEVAK